MNAIEKLSFKITGINQYYPNKICWTQERPDWIILWWLSMFNKWKILFKSVIMYNNVRNFVLMTQKDNIKPEFFLWTAWWTQIMLEGIRYFRSRPNIGYPNFCSGIFMHRIMIFVICSSICVMILSRQFTCLFYGYSFAWINQCKQSVVDTNFFSYKSNYSSRY